jgi:hypothetical protein
MKLCINNNMKKRTPKTKEEARQYAIDWQKWFSEENLSIQELINWQNEFDKIGKKFDLTEEFKENGII